LRADDLARRGALARKSRSQFSACSAPISIEFHVMILELLE
jgi:hypothetical protein